MCVHQNLAWSRPLLLDRIAERLPELDLDDNEVAWHQLPDGAPALLVDGGGLDGGDGMHLVNAGKDVHVVGPDPGDQLDRRDRRQAGRHEGAGAGDA